MAEDRITSRDIITDESRHQPRKKTTHIIQVTNAMTGEIIGRIGNLSLDGMMLILHQQLRENALFQFIVPLSGQQGQNRKLEIGVCEQWSEEGHLPGQFWAGFRIIDISPADYALLGSWVSNHQDYF